MGAALLSESQFPNTSEKQRRNGMNNFKKSVLLMGLLSVLGAIPAVAQIPNRVTFEAPAPFYAGNAKLPAGSYIVTQPDMNENLLLIQDTAGSHSVFVEYELALSGATHDHSDATFNKYGDVDFLSALWIEGQKSAMRISPSKVEQKAARAATAEKHTLSLNTGAPVVSN
jgi:hypothetical protein